LVRVLEYPIPKLARTQIQIDGELGVRGKLVILIEANPISRFACAMPRAVYERRHRLELVAALLLTAHSGSCGSLGATSESGARTTHVFAYMQSLMGGGKLMNGVHWDQYADASGGTYGNGLDRFSVAGSSTYPTSGQTPANITFFDNGSGNTELAPAILGVWLNTAFTCGSSLTLAQGLAAANGQLAAGGIVLINWAVPAPALNTDPASQNCIFSGTGAEWTPSSAPPILTPGSAIYDTYMYGPGGTADSPTGGVWGLAQALKQINGTVILRQLFENNLSARSWWFGTGGGAATSLQFVRLWKQTINYLRSLGVKNIIINFNLNYGRGDYRANDPGPSYRDIASIDWYGPTSQRAILSGMRGTLPKGGGGWVYLQSLGIPLLLSEFGGVSSSNRAVARNSYSLNVWNSALQAGATNLVGELSFTQHWDPSNQSNCLAWAQSTISRGQLPPGL
jgi:hypothetical protein